MKKRNKNQPGDLALYRAKTERLDKIGGHFFGFGRILVAGGVVSDLIFSVDAYLMHQAEQITAVGDIVKAFRLEVIIPTLATGLAVAAGLSERRGKQRAIKKAGEYQKRLEQGDPNRTSSGLTAIGTTPEEDS